ncbi:MAG: hypothetical protein Q7R95_11145, partial [bacterium]|nr:hypothetical protein [bacterium]
MSILFLYKHNNHYLKDILSSSILILLSIIFFLRLFYPTIKIIVTPDFQISDIFHYTFAEKHYLNHGLQLSSFNEYTNLLLSGQSLMSDGQLGNSNPINYIIYKYFPIAFGFNLNYIIYYIAGGIGMYFFTKRFTNNSSSSLLSSIIFIFSGTTIFKIPHFTLLQNILVIPFIFYIFDTILIVNNKKHKLILSCILVFLLDLQFSNGQFQFTMITLIGLFTYILLSVFMKIRTFKKIDIYCF